MLLKATNFLVFYKVSSITILMIIIINKISTLTYFLITNLWNFQG